MIMRCKSVLLRGGSHAVQREVHPCAFSILAMTEVHGQAALHLGAEMSVLPIVFCQDMWAGQHAHSGMFSMSSRKPLFCI